MARITRGVLAPLIALGSGIVLAAGLASAAQTTIGFDDLPDGTTIERQYANRGIVFGTAGGRDQLAVQGDDAARSAPNVASLSNCPADSEVIGCTNRATATLATPATAVTLYVGSTAPEAGGEPDVVVLEGFGADGASLDIDRVSVESAAPFTHELTITAPAATTIARIEIRLAVPKTTNARLAIDDLAISTADVATSPVTTQAPATTAHPPPPRITPPPVLEPPAPPDFAMALRSAGAPLETATVTSGRTETIDLMIHRSGVSSGRIDVSAVGGASMATITVEPGNDAYHKRLRIQAKTGKDAVGEAKVTLVGVPMVASAGRTPRTLDFTLRVIRRFDVRIIGMEISQGTQRTFGTQGSFQGPGLSGNDSPNYAGVPLTVGPRTVVRLFANVPSGAPVKDVGAALYGVRGNGNKALPGAPLFASSQSTALTPGPAIGGFKEHTSNANSFIFTLPPSWTSEPGMLHLSAELMAPPDTTVSLTGIECGQHGCTKADDNNGFSLVNIPVTTMPKITILPLALTQNGKSPPATAKVFSDARAASPLGGPFFEVLPYAAKIDVTDMTDRYDVGGIHYRVAQWGKDNVGRLSPRTILVGVLPAGVDHGVSLGDVSEMAAFLAPQNKEKYPPHAVVRGVGRGLTNVAHELGHQLGRPHASAACGADEGANLGEPWPPDEHGLLQGIGLDRRGPLLDGYRLLYDHDGLPQNVMFDYMSYCASVGDSDSWISPRNWTNMFNFLRGLGLGKAPQPASSSGAASPAGAGMGSAVDIFGSIVEGTEPTINFVGPARGPATASSSGTGLTLVARNGAGEVVGRATATVGSSHIDERPLRRITQFTGRIPGAGARSVELQGAGAQVLARRDASPTVPKVTLLSPDGRKPIGARGLTRVRARVVDPDPGSTHEVSLRISEDGGRSFRVLRSRGAHAAGVVGFDVPNRMLPATTRGVFEIVVNDGFHEAADRSRRVTIAGAPPVVRIEGRRRIGTTAGQTVSLEGSASDDRGLALPPRRLAWFDGRRRLGSGQTITLVRMRPGRHVVRLVATDRLGRKATARVIVRVAGAAPRFLLARGPRSLPRGARAVNLRIATTVPARVSAGGRTFSAGPRPRTVSVALPRRRTSVLRLVARAAGETTRLRIELPR
ncbi:MAG: PKD domain-containing protein [Chloroflexota bacterium]|nr:PKD domain-containing protein [Chloroflexota bacterium]